MGRAAWAVCLVLVGALAAAEPQEADPLWFLDPTTGRNLGAKVYWPGEGEGPWPVIIFSHGLGGSQWGYAYLGRYWAAHGYVCIHCSHPGSDWLLWDGKGMSDGLANLRKAQDDPALLSERPRDIACLIDQLPALEEKVPALAGRIDRGRIGVAGHSLGADTALAIAGMRVGAGQVDLSDPRPLAFVALSPSGTGPTQPAGSWSRILRPTLMVTGSEDVQPLASSHDLAWRLQAWTGLPAGDHHLVVIEDARHMTFAGGGLGVKAAPAQLAAIELVTTAFWDAALRDGSHVGVPPAPAGCSWRWESKHPPAGR